MIKHTLSCCCWALPGFGTDATPAHIAQIAALGFGAIDVRPQDCTSANLAAIQQHGLAIPTVAASFGIPADATLSSADLHLRQQAQEAVSAGLVRAAELGAGAAYIVPDFDRSSEALARFGESVQLLADRAQAAGIKLLIEHFPGRMLPTVAATLDFMRNLNHPSLFLLYDIGHVQISGESIRGTVHDAGELIGYVHLDDNDGAGDLHWALLDGVMTQRSLRELFDALDEIEYDDEISIELHPSLPELPDALRRSVQVVSTL